MRQLPLILRSSTVLSALQWVQAISGKGNVRRPQRSIEMGQDICNAPELIGPDLAGVTVLKQTL
jgi:hypothetical protein